MGKLSTQIITRYISETEKRFKVGCYRGWEDNRQKIMQDVLESFERDDKGYKRSQAQLERIRRRLTLCDSVAYSYFRELSKGIRLYYLSKEDAERLRQLTDEEVSKARASNLRQSA